MNQSDGKGEILGYKNFLAMWPTVVLDNHGFGLMTDHALAGHKQLSWTVLPACPLIIPAGVESDSHGDMPQVISVWYSALWYCPLHNVSIKPAVGLCWSTLWCLCSDGPLACVQTHQYSSSVVPLKTLRPHTQWPLHCNNLSYKQRWLFSTVLATYEQWAWRISINGY